MTVSQSSGVFEMGNVIALDAHALTERVENAVQHSSVRQWASLFTTVFYYERDDLALLLVISGKNMCEAMQVDCSRPDLWRALKEIDAIPVHRQMRRFAKLASLAKNFRVRRAVLFMLKRYKAVDLFPWKESDILEWLEDLDCLKTSVDSEGNSLLHLAVTRGMRELTKYVIN